MSARPHAQGALLLIAAMACFSLSDVMAKQLAGTVSPMTLAWLRFALLLTTVAPLALARPHLWRSRRPGLQLARAMGLAGSAVLFLFGLRALPVPEATAMVFASPFFVTLLAAWLLREQVPLRRWLPVTLGFAGVLIVARPGAPTFGAAALFPLLSSMAWATAVVSSRKLSATDPSATTMLYSSLAGTAVLGAAMPTLDQSMLMRHGWLLASMAIAWCAAQWLTITAYRLAPAATIAPFAYCQLVWAALLGFAAFGHVPDLPSTVGMAVIIVSGALAVWLSKPREPGGHRKHGI